MNTYHTLQALISYERLYMSEANQEHFDIEAADHLYYLTYHPEHAMGVTESITHRIALHKSRNMYLVPPMLFPLENESDNDHYNRELEAGGFVKVDFESPEIETDFFEKGPQEKYHHETETTKQQELF